jgi:hypothetical protein
MRISSSRARRESINCPQKARSNVWATVGKRNWRIPWNTRVASPISGSRAKRCRNSV